VDLRFKEHSSCLLLFHLENILELENIQPVWFVDLRFKERSSCLLLFHLENILELENIQPVWFVDLRFKEHSSCLLLFHLENIQLVWLGHKKYKCLVEMEKKEKVAAQKKAANVGTASLFYIPGQKGVLAHAAITARIAPTEVVGKARCQESEVFFLECRNLQKVPDQCKGLLCALRGAGSQWRLCYCWKFLVDRDCLQVFQWVGPTAPNPRTNDTGYVPSFCLGPIKNFREHFEPKSIKASSCTLLFLNQIHGERPGGHPYTFDRVNVIDGRFQCDPNGPDLIVLPVNSKVHFPDEDTLLACTFRRNYMQSIPSSSPKHFCLPPSCPQGDLVDPRRQAFENQGLPKDRKYHVSQKRNRTSRMHALMAPPKFVTLDTDDAPYEVVFVEDAPCRLEIDPVKDRNVVSIPFFVDICLE
jgi:hypothetical protein